MMTTSVVRGVLTSKAAVPGSALASAKSRPGAAAETTAMVTERAETGLQVEETVRGARPSEAKGGAVPLNTSVASRGRKY